MPRRPPAPRVPAPLLRVRFPVAVLEVLRRLDAAGHRSWLVGGAVRDILLRRHRELADLDVATPARPQQVMELFAKVVPTGIEHGTVTVLQRGQPVEVTTFRGEGAYVDGRRPSSVTFLDDVEQDLSRRDFTVNALAYDPIGRDFRDPFGGRDDLRRRLLRAVGDPAERFAEDGLRPVRAVRFVAQLGFRLDPRTARAIRPALSSTGRVSVERITEELSRLLVAAHARRGLELLDATGLAAVVLPDLATSPPYLRAHAFAAVPLVPPDLALRLAALFHVLAAGEAPLAASRRVRRALERMRFSGQVVTGAAALVLGHGCLLAAERPTPPDEPAGLRRWLAQVGAARVPSLLRLWEADVRALRSSRRRVAGLRELRGFRARLGRVRRDAPPLAAADLALDGRAVMALLGVPPGPAVGEAVRHLLDRVLEEPSLNTAEALASELREWWAQRPGSP